MDIKELIKENYEIAKSKGFYPDDSKIEEHLMGIVSELGEAYEAHRGGKFCVFKGIYKDLDLDILTEDMKYFSDHTYIPAIDAFEKVVKDSFEDEIADVFIRLFNLCGHYVDELNHDVIQKNFDNYSFSSINHSSVSFFLRHFDHVNIKNIGDDLFSKIVPAGGLGRSLKELFLFCIVHNIPIEKHIQAKKEYNKTRPNLHGKKY